MLIPTAGRGVGLGMERDEDGAGEKGKRGGPEGAGAMRGGVAAPPPSPEFMFSRRPLTR